MLKRFVVTLMSLSFVVSSVKADDDSLSIDVASIKDAAVETVDLNAMPDVDSLVADAGTEPKTDAIEACFRNSGYHNGCWNNNRRSTWYGNYNSSHCSPYSYSGSYSSYCAPQQYYPSWRPQTCYPATQPCYPSWQPQICYPTTQHCDPICRPQTCFPAWNSQSTCQTIYLPPTCETNYYNPCYTTNYVQPCYQTNYVQPCYQNNYTQECYQSNYVQPCYQDNFVQPCQQSQYIPGCHQPGFTPSCHQSHFTPLVTTTVWPVLRHTDHGAAANLLRLNIVV